MKNREDFSELSEHELQEKFRHFKEELFNLRFQAITGQLANPSRISVVRKNIARVQTYLTRMQKEQLRKELKVELEAMYKDKEMDPRVVSLKDKLALLRGQLNQKARKVSQTIRMEVDGKVVELLKSIRARISEKLKTVKGKEEAQWRSSSRRLRDPKFSIRKKFLDKLVSMGLNEASQIASLKETKRAKLAELDRIRAMQRELTSGRLPV